MAKSKASALINVDPDSGVRITSPSLEDTPDRDTILRGSIAPESLPFLRVDHTYQRELLRPSTNRDIQRAVDMGVDLPDLTLGMRGDRFTVDSGGAICLLDPVFIIDGQQRHGTIMRHLQQFPADPIRIGACVYFNTTAERERAKFIALNLYRTNMSANVSLANKRHDHPLLASLYGLVTTQPSFVMHKRVCWQQQRQGEQLISATLYVTSAMHLHAHMAATRSVSPRAIGLSLENLTRVVSIQVVRENVQTFWNVIDDAWGIEHLSIAAQVPYLRTGFLTTFAKILSDHTDFWDGQHLVVGPDVRKRLSRFKMNDPANAALASGHGTLLVQLRYVLLDHLNKQLRKKLTPRAPIQERSAA